jgi:hypothetical protein
VSSGTSSVKIPRHLQDDAAAIGTTKAAAATVARRDRDRARIAAMDPPTRAAAAVTMAVEGAGYDDIARVMDYRTPVEAKHAVWDAIAAVEADHENVERMRTLQARRLDKLLYSVFRQATTPGHPDQLSFGRYALAIMQAQRSLFGMDAAQQIVVYTPTQREIAAYAAQVQDLLRTQSGAIEADIIDVEVVDDDPDGMAGNGAASRAS